MDSSCREPFSFSRTCPSNALSVTLMKLSHIEPLQRPGRIISQNAELHAERKMQLNIAIVKLDVLSVVFQPIEKHTVNIFHQWFDVVWCFSQLFHSGFIMFYVLF